MYVQIFKIMVPFQLIKINSWQFQFSNFLDGQWLRGQPHVRVMYFLFSEHSQSFLMANRTCKTQEQIKKIQLCNAIPLLKTCEEIKTEPMHTANLNTHATNVSHRKLHTPLDLVI